VPSLLGQIPGQKGPAAQPAAQPASAISAFGSGLLAIPGLTDQQRQVLAAGVDQGATPAAAPPGPAGAAAVAALSSAPLGTPAAPSGHHRRGLVGGFLHWVGGLL
jgi:hypothetical protein